MEDPQYLSRVTAREERVDKRVTEIELKAGDSKEYEVEAIWDSAVYANKLKSGQLPGLYYLVAWKGYPDKKKTWKPLSAVQHIKKQISCFHKKHPKKPVLTFPPIDSALPIARPTARPTLFKRKHDRPASGASKRAKNWVLDARDI